MIEVEIRHECLAWTIIEIIADRIEPLVGIIILAQVAHTSRLADTLVLTGHVVGHEVDNHLQTGTMGAGDKLFELLHTTLHIHSQVGVDIVIVGDGIRRTCPTLHHSRMLARDAIAGVVGHRGMTDDARVPNMSHAQLPDFLQGAGREIVQFSTSVLFYRTINHRGIATMTEKTGENLIDDNLMQCHEHLLPC